LREPVPCSTFSSIGTARSASLLRQGVERHQLELFVGLALRGRRLARGLLDLRLQRPRFSSQRLSGCCFLSASDAASASLRRPSLYSEYAFQ
jgi:hypothetical protein